MKIQFTIPRDVQAQRYSITNQIEKGYRVGGLASTMPKFTYSFFIDEMEEMIWDYSVDTLKEGFSMVQND